MIVAIGRQGPADTLGQHRPGKSPIHVGVLVPQSSGSAVVKYFRNPHPIQLRRLRLRPQQCLYRHFICTCSVSDPIPWIVGLKTKLDNVTNTDVNCKENLSSDLHLIDRLSKN